MRLHDLHFRGDVLFCHAQPTQRQLENRMAKLMTRTGRKEHEVVSHDQWIKARKQFLAKEKKFTKLGDQLHRQRRDLPWEKVDKEYVFDGPNGKVTLAGLFGRNRQLILYHFMFGPGWKAGCAHCSFWCDHYDATRVHLNQRDTTLAVVSRAPLKKIRAFQKRMGWKFPWVSSFRSDFNFDYHVSFTPEEIKSGTLYYNYGTFKMDIDELQGVSAFYKDEKGDIFHTYSAHARGIDTLNTTYHFLDLTAKGRDENPAQPQDWVRYHDKYKKSSGRSR
jgi:predicted dithiol-disulfide oxidoreductase (DUF899 family)